MSYSIGRREFVGLVASAAVAGPMLAQQAMAEDGSKANPDGVHVIRQRWGWLVLPTGGDDHDNLEWALRHTPRGGVVRLVRGTYKFGSPVIVPNFDGILEGAGTQGTTLTCTDELNYELWVNSGGAEKDRPPDFPRVPIDGSATKSAPAMILFYKRPPEDGDDLSDHANSITVRGIRCRGAMRGEPWAFGDEVLSINVINSIDWADPGVRQVTTRQDFTLSDVDVDGFASGKFGVFGNGCACITVLGGPVLTDNYNLQGAVGDALSFQMSPARRHAGPGQCHNRTLPVQELPSGSGRCRISGRHRPGDRQPHGWLSWQLPAVYRSRQHARDRQGQPPLLRPDRASQFPDRRRGRRSEQSGLHCRGAGADRGLGYALQRAVRGTRRKGTESRRSPGVRAKGHLAATGTSLRAALQQLLGGR